ncbi:hypothetical protein D3C80_687390 [compost metagenome]
MRYNFSDWLGLQLEVAYMQKNYAIRRSFFFKGVESEIKNSSLQLPLMAHFSFGGEDLRVFLNLGAYSEYWVNSRIRGAHGSGFRNPNDDEVAIEKTNVLFSDLIKLENFDQKVDFDTRRDRRMQFGLIAGVGMEYRLSPKFKVFTEARYQHNLTDLQKNYMINQIPRYNNTFGVQLGVFYAIGR